MFKVLWNNAEQRQSHCPICERIQERAVLATLQGQFAHLNQSEIFVIRCDDCKVSFCDPIDSVEYSNIDDRGLQFYVEAGAGIDSILAPFNLLDSRPISRMLDIGCSFGYCLDFGQQIHGWEVRGYDPGAIARYGKEILNLPIENHYFSNLDLNEGPFDLIFFSEVIEHISDPAAFFQLLDRALAPDGVILMTTPNGELLDRQSPDSILFPILSPGHHVIYYTRAGLTKLLSRYGFSNIRIRENGAQLQFATSRKPFESNADYFNRPLYKTYLAQRYLSLPTGATSLGFAFRLFKEQVNSCEFAEALDSYSKIRADIQSRFNIDIEDLAVATNLSGMKTYEAFGAKYPFSLGSIWYFRGVIESLHFSSYAKAAAYFAASFDYIAELRHLLIKVGIEDGELADLILAAEAGRIQALTASSPACAIARALTLKDDARFPSSQDSQRSIQALCRRIFTDLINSNEMHYANLIWESDLELASDETKEPNFLVSVGMYFLLYKSNFIEAECRFRSAVDALKGDALKGRRLQAVSGLIESAFRIDPDHAVSVFSEVLRQFEIEKTVFEKSDQIVLTRGLLRDLVNSGRSDIVAENLEIFIGAIEGYRLVDDPAVLLAIASILIRKLKRYTDGAAAIDRIYQRNFGSNPFWAIVRALEIEMMRPLTVLDPSGAINICLRMLDTVVRAGWDFGDSGHAERVRVQLFIDLVNAGDHARAAPLIEPMGQWIKLCRDSQRVDLLFTTGVHLLKFCNLPQQAAEMLDIAHRQSKEDKAGVLLSTKIASALVAAQKTFDLAGAAKNFAMYLRDALAAQDSDFLEVLFDLFQRAISEGDYKVATHLLNLKQASSLLSDKSESIPGLAFALGLVHLNYTGEVEEALVFLTSAFNQTAGVPDLASLHTEVAIGLLNGLIQHDVNAAINWFMHAADNKSDQHRLIKDARIYRLREILATKLISQGNYLEVQALTREDEFRSDEVFLSSSATNLFSKGIFLLNHKADYHTAARIFRAVVDLSAGPEGADGMYWHGLFHEGVARKMVEDDRRTQEIIDELMRPCQVSVDFQKLYLARIAELAKA